jgi:hypothetical protein
MPTMFTERKKKKRHPWRRHSNFKRLPALRLQFALPCKPPHFLRGGPGSFSSLSGLPARTYNVRVGQSFQVNEGKRGTPGGSAQMPHQLWALRLRIPLSSKPPGLLRAGPRSLTSLSGHSARV